MAEFLSKNKFDINKIDKNKIYFVEWHDAYSSSGWHSDEQLYKFVKLDKCICQEVGWILYETDEEIVMGSRTLKWSRDGDYEWGLLQKIPKAWIKKKICFNLNPKKKK